MKQILLTALFLLLIFCGGEKEREPWTEEEIKERQEILEKTGQDTTPPPGVRPNDGEEN